MINNPYQSPRGLRQPTGQETGRKRRVIILVVGAAIGVVSARWASDLFVTTNLEGGVSLKDGYLTIAMMIAGALIGAMCVRVILRKDRRAVKE